MMSSNQDPRQFEHFCLHCQLCFSAFDRYGAYTSHNCTNKQQTDVICGHCGHRFIDRETLALHINVKYFHLQTSQIPNYDKAKYLLSAGSVAEQTDQDSSMGIVFSISSSVSSTVHSLANSSSTLDTSPISMLSVPIVTTSYSVTLSDYQKFFTESTVSGSSSPAHSLHSTAHCQTLLRQQNLNFFLSSLLNFVIGLYFRRDVDTSENFTQAELIQLQQFRDSPFWPSALLPMDSISVSDFLCIIRQHLLRNQTQV